MYNVQGKELLIFSNRGTQLIHHQFLINTDDPPPHCSVVPPLNESGDLLIDWFLFLSHHKRWQSADQEWCADPAPRGTALEVVLHQHRETRHDREWQRPVRSQSGWTCRSVTRGRCRAQLPDPTGTADSREKLPEKTQLSCLLPEVLDHVTNGIQEDS